MIPKQRNRNTARISYPDEVGERWPMMLDGIYMHQLYYVVKQSVEYYIISTCTFSKLFDNKCHFIINILATAASFYSYTQRMCYYNKSLISSHPFYSYSRIIL